VNKSIRDSNQQGFGYQQKVVSV